MWKYVEIPPTHGDNTMGRYFNHDFGAFCVPAGFSFGSTLLLSTGESNSFQYLAGSALVIICSILVWSTAMGTTFPFVMAFVDEFEDSYSSSFSLLYLANVAGAVLGAITTVAVLIELLGLHHTLVVAASLNALVASVALSWGFGQKKQKLLAAETERAPVSQLALSKDSTFYLLVLFATGFVSMAMEVVWTREFTRTLGTMVYSFALLLATYLLATCAGSYFYRRHSALGVVAPKPLLLSITAAISFLPIIAGDFRLLSFAESTHYPLQQLIVLLSIAPFCCWLGYLTPLLIDDLSQGDPVVAGKIYALNIAGCILGPLLAGYILLPMLGVRLSLVILALPLVLLACTQLGKLARNVQIFAVMSFALLVSGSVLSRCWEDGAFSEASNVIVRRDYAATVVSYGKGMDRRLLVNGIGITTLTPLTKFMAHLPLAFLTRPAENALVICFGMGTTYKALLSWGIHATAVELVPSVTEAFDYYHDDAKTILQNPRGKIVIDDGRRFLARTREKFDVITIDPPPPIEAAGSSLLYSEDFYKILKQHLKDGGILQQWVPEQGNSLSAVARSLVRSFPYVRAFDVNEGCHFLASEKEIPDLTEEQFIAKLPVGAINDLQEWCPGANSQAEMKKEIDIVFSQKLDLKKILKDDPSMRITDDRPFNEYYWLRQHFSPIGK